MWAQLQNVDLSVVGWISRILPLLLLGVLLGQASDRLRRTETQRRALEVAAQRHRQAIEVNDTLIQGMAATKWALEVGRVQTALDTLNHTLALGQQLVSALMHDAAMGARTHETYQPPSHED